MCIDGLLALFQGENFLCECADCSRKCFQSYIDEYIGLALLIMKMLLVMLFYYRYKMVLNC